jgi:chemotaxis-related protein WspD
VHADAAQRTLRQPVDSSYREHWAAALREPPAAGQANDAAALVFRLGREWLALPAAMAASVAPVAPVHRLPHRSNAELLGIVQIDGRLTPAVSLAALLGIGEHDAADSSGRHVFPRLLVLAALGHSFAVPVAELHGIVRYPAASLTPPAATLERPHTGYLTGVLAHAGMQVGVLDGDVIGHRFARLLK